MARRKTDHAASSRYRLTAYQFAARGRRLAVRHNGSEIVCKNIRSVVFGVFRVAGALVAWAEIAFWVVRGTLLRRGAFYSAQPRSLSTVRRDKDPIARQSVVSAVRTLVQVHDWKFR